MIFRARLHRCRICFAIDRFRYDSVLFGCGYGCWITRAPLESCFDCVYCSAIFQVVVFEFEFRYQYLQAFAQGFSLRNVCVACLRVIVIFIVGYAVACLLFSFCFVSCVIRAVAA